MGAMQLGVLDELTQALESRLSRKIEWAKQLEDPNELT
jgi:hypothetical protein